MNRRDDTSQRYCPSSSVAAHHGSAEDTDGEGYSMAHHPALPVSQYLPDERAHDFVQEQDGGPYMSVNYGRSSDLDPDIELLDSTGQPVRQPPSFSSGNASPRTAYRQVEQRLGAMRNERLANRTDVGHAAVLTHHRQTVYNADHAYARIAPQQHKHQDQYSEQVRVERINPRIGLIRHDNGQTYQIRNRPGGHIQYLDDGSAAYQYNNREDFRQDIEDDTDDNFEQL